MILVVDNHGFTTNILTHQLGAVHLITAAELAALNLTEYTHVVIGHGTDIPDLTVLHAVPDIPVLAIGAGYQHLAAAYGHTATAPAQPVYGQPIQHHHTQTGLFAGLPNPIELITYHAWRLATMDPAVFTSHAVDDAENVLAYHVKGTNHWGLHADPAALQSTAGTKLVENFVALATTAQHVPQDTSATKPNPRSIELFTRDVPGRLDTAATFAAVQAEASAAFWLDSSAAHLGQGDTTIMGTNTGELSQTIRWDVDTNRLDVQDSATRSQHTANVLQYISEHGWETPQTTPGLSGFTGGWVGYLGYEAKQATVIGHTNTWRAPTPDAYWIRPQTFLRYDHRNHRTTLFAYADESLLDQLEAALVFGDTPRPEPAQRTEVNGQWHLSATEYQQRVSHIRRMLQAGDAAGICLTDTFSKPEYLADGLALYLRLRTNNPAPYGGYLRFNTFDDELEILASSPEKFLSVNTDGHIESKPIKGTVARSSDPVVDVDVAQHMAADPKIQSENLMITDLLRDDLAKVTTPGSVRVPKLMTVESFATVHQLVTTVTGALRPGLSATAALNAVFPGGSMTGAPRFVSLETLDTLEAGPRGIYSGAMGWLGDNNTAELNVVIRSIVIDSGHLTLGAGGAVVVDSEPAEEEAEKHLKAQALMTSIAEQQ